MKPRVGFLDLTGGAELRHDAARLRLKNTSGRGTGLDKRDDFDTLVPASVSEIGSAIDTLVRLRRYPSPPRWLVTYDRRASGPTHSGCRSPVTGGELRHPPCGVVSPKASLAVGPWHSTEFYANAGRGFHSNHAAGVLQRVDPVTGDLAMSNGRRVESAPPIAGTTGAEIGLRTQPLARTRLSLALWSIQSDSELLYTPEDGVTSPERPGQRWGVEWLNFVQLRRSLTLDLDAALFSRRITVRTRAAKDAPFLTRPASSSPVAWRVAARGPQRRCDCATWADVRCCRRKRPTWRGRSP